MEACAIDFPELRSPFGFAQGRRRSEVSKIQNLNFAILDLLLSILATRKLPLSFGPDFPANRRPIRSRLCA